MLYPSQLGRFAAALAATALALTLGQLPAQADVPGDTWSASFEASSPAPSLAAYGTQINLTGKRYTPGSVSPYIDVANMKASGSYNSSEVFQNIVDGSTATKWLDSRTPPYWVSLPLTQPKAVALYKISAANDAQDRDPGNWTLAGSNDATCAQSPTTASWTTVDTRSGVTFGARFETQTFTVPQADQAPYSCYRLNITARRGNATSSGMMQFSELELLDGTDAQPPATPMVLAVGNGPISGYNMKPSVGWDGLRALSYVGSHLADGDASGSNVLYDGLNVSIGEHSQLSYALFPIHNDNDLSHPEQYVAVDLEYVDPAAPSTPHRLSETNLTVQYGFAVTPQEQGRAKKLWSSQWNKVTVDLSSLAGKTVTKVL
ncbi:MAG: discoidin domain-containing protein, partial [Bifidobacteriaceae bacterium]|nr:discoidin domain-containing protein [Bifidobacteriaceae bacterium]